MFLGEGAQAMRRIDASMPVYLDLGQQFVGHSRDVAANLNRITRPRWYDRLLGYGLNGAVLYRSLNPATNLSIKSAQFVSSRP